MDFELFRRRVKQEIFDYQLLVDSLKSLKKPRDKIRALLAEGKIIRLKKGLYVFGENWRKATISLEIIGNMLYGPSCISFEYALNRYGFLAERSAAITSLAIGATRNFHTPLGVFEYRAIGREKFNIGIEYKDLGEGGGYFIASKEKAFADLIYRTPHIRTLTQLRHYLFEELRVDEAAFRELNKKALCEIATIYKKNSIILLSKL